MKANEEQIDEELMVIKLFSCNYARDLLYPVSLWINLNYFIKAMLKP